MIINYEIKDIPDKMKQRKRNSSSPFLEHQRVKVMPSCSFLILIILRILSGGGRGRGDATIDIQ